uniref:Gypsy retrotransposon integrase-like protein 1 n=1 Tax=Naja naja TaxID=35670 RepID=A0A8C7E2N1_NAJNA
MREDILNKCHDEKPAEHFGFLKTLHLTLRQFWWPNMRPEIEHYVKTCHVCAMSKPRTGKPLGLLQQVSEPSRPWQDIAMDFIVELPSSKGYNVIWTIVDLFSKQAHFVPCKGLPSAGKLAELFIQHVYRLHGSPRRIISDRGVQFTAQFWKAFVKLLGSSQGLSTANHPSTNGAAERANAMVEQYLRTYIAYQQQNWMDLLPFTEIAYNNAVHSSTGYSPFYIVHGIEFVPIPTFACQPEDPLRVKGWAEKIQESWGQVQKSLRKMTSAHETQANKKQQDHKPFAVGDKVY